MAIAKLTRLFIFVDADQYPKKVEFHRPLSKRPPDLRRIDDSVYDPYWWEAGRPNKPTTVRRVDNPFSQVRFPRPNNRPNGHRRQNHIQPHPNHNYNPQQVPLRNSLSRPPHYQTSQYFNPHYNPIHSRPGLQTPSRRKDSQRFGNGGYHKQQVI